MGENGAAVMQSVTQSGLVGMQMGLAGMQQQERQWVRQSEAEMAPE